MRAIIQRVTRASVSVDGRIISEIQRGIVSLVAIQKEDSEAQVKRMMDKIIGLRIFEDPQGKMNLSLLDIQGEHLIVSQFTLAGDCSKGRRPSFIGAETPERARVLVQLAAEESRKMGIATKTGEFQAHMEVSLVNDGPVTFILEA